MAMTSRLGKKLLFAAVTALLCVGLAGCAQQKADEAAVPSESSDGPLAIADKPVDETAVNAAAGNGAASDSEKQGDAGQSGDQNGAHDQGGQPNAPTGTDAQALYDQLGVTQDFRSNFDHGDKSAAFQKYIVLHDTEGDADAANVIDWWDGNGNMVSSHFVINTDGSIWQCVPIDRIAHHAGFGDAGHNDQYGVQDESRDDKRGTSPIGDWAPDYGMNSYSVGIEMVHVGGTGYYPEEQLNALDRLIAYIDAYYGFQSTIIDHKMWRSGNSDTSPEFAGYLANYMDHRTHN